MQRHVALRSRLTVEDFLCYLKRATAPSQSADSADEKGGERFGEYPCCLGGKCGR